MLTLNIQFFADDPENTPVVDDEELELSLDADSWDELSESEIDEITGQEGRESSSSLLDEEDDDTETDKEKIKRQLKNKDKKKPVRNFKNGQEIRA